MRALPVLALFLAAAALQAAPPAYFEQPRYSVTLEPGPTPRLHIDRDGEPVFVVPVVSGLATPTREEHLSQIQTTLRRSDPTTWELEATAKSDIWQSRRFLWRFLPDRIEFQHWATGSGPLGRCYFLSNGVSHGWDAGTTGGLANATLTYADRYFTPSPNHANLFEFATAQPQILGFDVGRQPSSDADFRPERMTGLFQPPPLFLAFHMNRTWTGIGIGARPGSYQFPAFESTGARYAGTSFYVDYMGYQQVSGEFASPALALTFAYDPLDALAAYTGWLDQSGFSTRSTSTDTLWHHLPIFCGWAEQTSEATPQGLAPNSYATQKNYEKWIATLEERGLPLGTIVIDDKWQKHYGTFDVDEEKWPDLKAFIATQHAKGRHVLLWVPVAHADGLPDSLCVHAQGKCVTADVGSPAYEEFLRPRLRHLVQDLGVDGFKEDWVGAPAAPGLALTGPYAGLEWTRRFQWILYSETHRWRPDALIETQTPNTLFRESSDVLRLNDIWYATRNVADTLRTRARIAHISGWPVVDADNASSTTLRDWWAYMQAQPSIGIPALYFTGRTESTLESPTPEQWTQLASLWRDYVAQTKARYATASEKEKGNGKE